MEKDTMNTLELIQCEPKRTVIPDNDYLPFMSMPEILGKMEVGDIFALPFRKYQVLRCAVVKVNKRGERKFRCYRNRDENTADVCRLS